MTNPLLPLSSGVPELTKALDDLIYKAKRCANICPLPVWESDLAAARKAIESLWMRDRLTPEEARMLRTDVASAVANMCDHNPVVVGNPVLRQSWYGVKHRFDALVRRISERTP